LALHHAFSDHFGDDQRPLDRRIRQDHRELVAAIATDDIVGATALRDLGRDQAQNAVTDEVTELVVEMLEIVDVDQKQRERAVVLVGLLDQSTDRSVEHATIGDPGQRIGQCLALDQVETILQDPDLLRGFRQLALKRLVGAQRFRRERRPRISARFDYRCR
jgi:hypothetical protein